MKPVPAGSAAPQVVTRTQQTKTNTQVMFLSYRSGEPLNCCEFPLQRVPDGVELPLVLSWWPQDTVSSGEKAKPTCEIRNPLRMKNSVHESSLLIIKQVFWPQINRDVGRGKTETAWFGSPCAHHAHPSVILAEITVLPGSHPFIDRCTLTHTWKRTSLIDSAEALPGKAKPARNRSAHPTWCFILSG